MGDILRSIDRSKTTRLLNLSACSDGNSRGICCARNLDAGAAKLLSWSSIRGGRRRGSDRRRSLNANVLLDRLGHILTGSAGAECKRLTKGFVRAAIDAGSVGGSDGSVRSVSRRRRRGLGGFVGSRHCVMFWQSQIVKVLEEYAVSFSWGNSVVLGRRRALGGRHALERIRF
jgi:hypothetical protein